MPRDEWANARQRKRCAGRDVARDRLDEADHDASVNAILSVDRKKAKAARREVVGEKAWVHLDVAVIRRETDKAIQVVLTDGTIHWLPLSQIADSDDYEAGQRNCTVSIPEWLAIEKGLA